MAGVFNYLFPFADPTAFAGSDSMETLAPVGGAVIGGAFGGPAGAMAGATAGSAIASASAQKRANQTNIDLARQQMEFQERMSNSAYQRAMADMRKAGLNPMLAISQGGASTPSGASTTVAPVDFGKAAPAALTAALETKSVIENINKVRSDTKINEKIPALQEAQTEAQYIQNRINSANAVKAEAEAEFLRKNPWMVPVQQYMGAGSSAMGIATGAGKLIEMLKSNTKTKGRWIP